MPATLDQPAHRPAAQAAPAPAVPLHDVGAVVIGRNEGQRLRRCLESLPTALPCVVYADSGSSDGSPVLARALGARVVALTEGPFTASRGRAAGLEDLLARRPLVEFVQFVDGDCILEPDWVAIAVDYLRRHPRIGAVCGLLREEHATTNFYSRIGQADWSDAVGPVAHCGGIAMLRARAIREAGGWRPDLVAGEEPELCARLRRHGWQVVRLAVPMARHDLGMRRFSQWWRRQSRSGYGAMDVACFGGPGCRDLFGRQLTSAAAWGLGWPALSIAGAAGAWAALGPAAGAAWIGLAGLALAAQAARIARAGRRRGLAVGDAAAYAGLTMLSKPVQCAGALRCLADRARRRHGSAVDYKQERRAGAQEGAAC